MVIRQKYGRFGDPITAAAVLPIVTGWLSPPKVEPMSLSTSTGIEATSLSPVIAIVGGVVALGALAFIATKVMK